MVGWGRPYPACIGAAESLLYRPRWTVIMGHLASQPTNHHGRRRDKCYIPNIPGFRGHDFLDSKFLTGDGAWWGCYWVRDDGKLDFIVNSSETQTSEFVECNGLWLFDLDIDGTRRPIIVSYRQVVQGVSTHIFHLSLKCWTYSQISLILWRGHHCTTLRFTHDHSSPPLSAFQVLLLTASE